MRKLSLALLASGTLLSTGLLTSAQAAFITGIMQVGGGSNIVEITTNSPLTGTIGFVPGSVVLPAQNGTTGDFVPFAGMAVTFPGQNNVMPTQPTQLDFNNLTAAANQPFLSVVGGLTFTLMTESTALAPLNGVPFFFISGTGTFHLAGFDDTPGAFTLSTQSVNGAFENTSFSASAVAVPGPIVGAGLPGFVSALFSGGLWWRRRQRKVA